ncbi:MAG TPA: ROK family protein [Ktedonobacteraceae bacterium]|nr:ROK family protein [Ktedonobacteraceae bacterium]
MEILKYIHAQAKPISRAQIVEAFGVSRSKISGEVAGLLQAGLLAEEGLKDSDGGRPSTLLYIPRTAGLIAAVDLGVTSMDVALTTLGGSILARRSESCHIRHGPEVILPRIKTLLTALLAEQGATPQQVVGIGIGIPGPVEHGTGIPFAPPQMPEWDRFPFKEAFIDEYSAPVFVDNDANVMALGEHRRGAAIGVHHVIFVKVGTGIGSGIIANGTLYRGAQGSAGDLGHISLDPNGPLCICGNKGCLGALAGGDALARRAEEAARKDSSSLLCEMLEEKGCLDAVNVGKAAARGDACAIAIIREAAKLIGEALAILVSLLNPDMIVIGGGVARIGNILLAEIRSVIYQRSLPLATRHISIVPTKLDHVVGVIGANALAMEGLLEKGMDSFIR